MIVVDASVVAEWYLMERRDATIGAALLEALRGGVVSSGNLWVETLEALRRAVRQKRLASDDLASAVAHLSGLDIHPTFATLRTISELAQRYGLSAYDAGYLATAKLRGFHLATVDDALADAAKAEGCLWTPPSPEDVERTFSLLLAG
jgi:predicted nucleic acid-binding protein